MEEIWPAVLPGDEFNCPTTQNFFWLFPPIICSKQKWWRKITEYAFVQIKLCEITPWWRYLRRQFRRNVSFEKEDYYILLIALSVIHRLMIPLVGILWINDLSLNKTSNENLMVKCNSVVSGNIKSFVERGRSQKFLALSTFQFADPMNSNHHIVSEANPLDFEKNLGSGFVKMRWNIEKNVHWKHIFTFLVYWRSNAMSVT